MSGIPGTMMKGSLLRPMLTHMAYITLAEKEDWRSSSPYPLRCRPVT